MNTLHSIELNNVVYLKEAKLDLNYDGITWITGKNLNAKMKGRNNGAGKSLLVSPLAQLMANSLPTQEKGQRSSKNAFYENGTSTVLTQTVNGVTYRSTKSMAKNKVLWNIAQLNEKTGHFEDMEFATPSKAEAFALGLSSLTQEEIFSTLYLDSRRPFVMVTGTPSERFNYMSNLFRLQDYDVIREMAKADLDRVKAQEVELTTLREQYEDNVVDPASLRKWKRLADRSLKKAKAADDKVEALRKDAEALRMYRRHVANVDLLDVNLKDLKRKWDRQVKSESAYQAYQQAQKELRVANRKLAKAERSEGEFMLAMKDACNRVSVPFSLKDDVAKVLKTLAAALDKAAELYEEQIKLIEDLDAERIALEDDLLTVQDLDKELRVLKRKLKGAPTDKEVYGEKRVLEHRIVEIQKHLKKHDGGKCVTCGGAYPAKKAERDMAKMQDRLEKLDAISQQYADLDEAQKERDNLWNGTTKEMSAEIDEVTERLVAAQGVMHAMKREVKSSPWESLGEGSDLWAKAGVEWESISRTLSDLRKTVKRCEAVKKVAKPESNAKLKDQYIAASAVHRDRELIEAGMLLIGSPDHLTEAIEYAEKQIKVQERVATKAYVTAGKFESKVTEGQRTVRKLAKVKRRIRELREATKFKRSYEAIYDAYGKNGVKLNHVQALCEKITTNLNKYSHLLFPEKFRFKLVAGQNTFDVLVSRPTGEGADRVSDALHLSGSEGRSFQLLWLISVLPLLPANRRYNVCILDEMEATMDEPSRELMIREFLPALNEIIPHVVFISPNSDNTPGHRYRHLEVVKKGRVSTVNLLQEVA